MGQRRRVGVRLGQAGHRRDPIQHIFCQKWYKLDESPNGVAYSSSRLRRRGFSASDLDRITAAGGRRYTGGRGCPASAATAVTVELPERNAILLRLVENQCQVSPGRASDDHALTGVAVGTCKY
jgi:hypothetical protein